MVRELSGEGEPLAELAVSVERIERCDGSRPGLPPHLDERTLVIDARAFAAGLRSKACPMHADGLSASGSATRAP